MSMNACRLATFVCLVVVTLSDGDADNQKRLLRQWLAVRQAATDLPTTTESPASTDVTSSTCSEDLFTCNNGECALKSWRCDGDADCDDGSDELDCPAGATCDPRLFPCATTSRCIAPDRVCDRHDDCGDGSDEQNCTFGTTELPTTSCDPDQFQCVTSGRCITQRWICDRDNDCGDNSDEQNCTSDNTELPGPVGPDYESNCPPEFRRPSPGLPGCYHRLTVNLRWQSAADYCRAINPGAHLVAFENVTEIRNFAYFAFQTPQSVATACPYWWTAGQRVDDSTINSPFVWRTFGRSCPAGGCLSKLTIPSSWAADAQGNGVPEGQPGCVMFTLNRLGIPWQLAKCETHACAFCEVAQLIG